MLDLNTTFLSDQSLHDFWEKALSNPSWLENPVSLYVHFPWCRSKCKYCVFETYNFNMMDKEFIDKYEQATVESIRKMDDLLRNRNIYEIYFGGGTPSLWSYKNESKIPQLLSSYNRIHRRITEVHPSDLNSERINFIANTMKFNIVSIGIQSFDYDSNISQHRIPADIEKLSNSIEWMINHKADRDRMSLNARLSTTQYQAEKIMPRWVKLFDDVIKMPI